MTMSTKPRKPGIGALCIKQLAGAKEFTKTLRGKIGLFLLVTNFPLGYGGLALGPILAKSLNDKRWLLFSPVSYALSWIMLGAATILLGAAAKNIILNSARKKYRAWKRLRKVRHESVK